ncbi:hypothetical protein BU14_0203s0002 [Porphyra umbilicalis]|uniref:Uncharacterized protein n=1 Tax=Porphyra umbilicalis TaxID=2786 RepID=A0A1X6P5L8_PORUM|nr:hypothetical protein BU14_0203s0002 [Porphyra umbilicalis]|eukprot:OSX76191.1 hypothetical protein BU14_0203s0002 [Porphyra umbilicalis]
MARFTLPLLVLLVAALVPLVASASPASDVLSSVARTHGGPHDVSTVKAGTCGGYVKCGKNTVKNTVKNSRYCYFKLKTKPSPAKGDSKRNCKRAPYSCKRVASPCNGWYKCKCDECSTVKTEVDRWCLKK